MEAFTKCSLVYFSPTFTTKKVLWSLVMAMKMNLPTIHYNLSTPIDREKNCHLLKDELVFVGVPSYYGRVPMVAPKMFENIRGDGSKAVILSIYGNNGYGDTLVEMRNTLSDKGFQIVAAAAVNSDEVGDGASAAGAAIIQDFADRIKMKVSESEVSSLLNLPGQYPYKPLEKPKTAPETGDHCIYCMNCIRWCPAGAISGEDPKNTDSSKCIACMGCIKRCPVKAKAFANADDLNAVIKASVVYSPHEGRINSQLFL